MKNRIGTMLRLSSANCQSIISMATMIPTKLSRSDRLWTMSSKDSCSCSTSLWLRDMIRPTGVRWKNDGDNS